MPAGAISILKRDTRLSGDGQMNPATNSDDEWELVDEDHVVVDLVGLVNNETLQTCDKKRIKLIGILDAEQPVLQLDRQVFVGERLAAPGTFALFRVSERDQLSSDEENNLAGKDGSADPNVKLELAYCTTKRLVMHQAFLSKKKSEEG